MAECAQSWASRRWAVSVKITHQIDHVTHVERLIGIGISGFNRARSRAASVEIGDQVDYVPNVYHPVTVGIATRDLW